MRARARLEKERMKTPETRREVHSFHVKRRLLNLPYDPTRRGRGLAQEPIDDSRGGGQGGPTRCEGGGRGLALGGAAEEAAGGQSGGESHLRVCKRARQERQDFAAPSQVLFIYSSVLLCRPLWIYIRPMPGYGVTYLKWCFHPSVFSAYDL